MFDIIKAVTYHYSFQNWAEVGLGLYVQGNPGITITVFIPFLGSFLWVVTSLFQTYGFKLPLRLRLFHGRPFYS